MPQFDFVGQDNMERKTLSPWLLLTMLHFKSENGTGILALVYFTTTSMLSE